MLSLNSNFGMLQMYLDDNKHYVACIVLEYDQYGLNINKLQYK